MSATQVSVSVTTPDGASTSHDITLNTRSGINVLVHPQGMMVDVAGFVEVNPQDTIACMQKMSEGAWRWISRGDLFKMCWAEAFDPKHTGQPAMTIPATLALLNRMDMGMRHVAGLIVLSCEAIFAKKNVFLRNPECYLHPATERYIVSMIEKLIKWAGASSYVATETRDEPQNITVPDDGPSTVAQRRIEDPAKVADLVVEWLACKDPNTDVARVGDKVYKPAELIIEVQHGTEIGQMLIAEFCKKQNPQS